MEGLKITNNEVLCGSYLCDTMFGLMTSYHISRYYDDKECEIHCKNTEVNKIECGKDEEQSVLPSGQFTNTVKICNDVCDTISCEDEAVCNGYMYGIFCKQGDNTRYYVKPREICDNVRDCDKGEDEANCTVTANTSTACKHSFTEQLVPVHNFTRCYSVKMWPGYCVDEDAALYLTNCTDPARARLRCKINGFMSTVSRHYVCSDYKHRICDDGIEKNCFETKTCKIHKHLMCNKEKDCIDSADETHQICRSMTKQTCQRKGGKIGELPIPTSWIKDGVEDCEDGFDESETADWRTCGKGKTLRHFFSDYTKCENVFICRTGDPGYIELNKLCDGLDTCGNENAVCSVSSRSYDIATSVFTTNRGLIKWMSYCLKGLDTLEKLKSSCINVTFIYPNEDIFGGSKTSLILPNHKQSCDHMYGEQYLYTSCTGRCISATCPLRNIPRYEVCPDQYPDRIGTIVNNKYLIFLTRSFGTIYTNKYFVCEDNSRCLDYNKVCDLVYDCDDHSDEFSTYCTNHFKCNKSKHLLPKTKKCDGHIDCADLSDECNEECTGAILEGVYIEGLSWTIGTIAVAANLVIIGKSLWTLKRCRTAVAVMNRCLIIMIAFGDFLIGCYLSIIATYDTIAHKNDYCKKQVEWITSSECWLMGVVSTIGSQISLFSMTSLSIVRIYGIWNSMKLPGEITGNKVLRIFTIMLILISASALIAVLPILGILENYFVNALKFSDELKIFKGTSDRTTIFSVIQSYFGRTRDSKLSWKTLIQIVREMFSHDYKYDDFTTKIDKVEFYGNDGVCLFKYFVKDEDPQRKFVWSILALNFICFGIIAYSYFLIGILSRRSTKGLALSPANQHITQRNRRMNRRIAVIITTDFLCWIPFIVTCILHSLEVVDATPWYSIFSMIILPINSVINPFLYDGTVTNTIAVIFTSTKTRVWNSAIGNYLTSLANIWSQFSARISNSVLLQAVGELLSPPPTEAVEHEQFETNV